MQLKCLSFNFRNAHSDIKNSLALYPEDIQTLSMYLKELLPITELFILSTCNRTEFYYSISEEVIEFKRVICMKLGVEACPSGVFITQINEEVEVVKHLFEVAVGQHSQIPGDVQVIYQIKEAYQLAVDANTVGVHLHHLLHQVFQVNKRVVNETDFKKGASSVASAAIQLVEELVGTKRNTPILLIGAGKNGEDTLKNLQNSGFQNVTICNRTDEKARQIAEKYHINYGLYADLSELIDQHYIIITSVNSRTKIIDSSIVDVKALHFNYTYFIDLSVPSAVDSAIEVNPSFLVYGIEYMVEKNNNAISTRISELSRVGSIIEEEALIFEEWKAIKLMTNAFEKYQEALLNLKKEEFQAYLLQIALKEGLNVSSFEQRSMQKIVEQSVLSWSFKCKSGLEVPNQLKELMFDVFDFDTNKINSFNQK